MTIESVDGTPIRSLADWERLGGPQRGHQWADGRSAKECARAWLRGGRPAVPAELIDLFGTHPLSSGLVVEVAVPEVETKLDGFRGKGRVHDLVLEGHASGRRVVVSVEAKADESFGDLAGQARRRALKRSERSKVGARIDLLAASVLGPGVEVDGLRYQLLYAVAGALIEARRRGAEVAVLVVHEFAAPEHTRPERRSRNAADFEAMLAAMRVHKPPGDGVLVQVPAVQGGRYVPSGISLLMGKVRAP